jgi:hypothetical protein
MDWGLMLMIGVTGGLSTLCMINIFWYFHDKKNKK